MKKYLLKYTEKIDNSSYGHDPYSIQRGYVLYGYYFYPRIVMFDTLESAEDLYKQLEKGSTTQDHQIVEVEINDKNIDHE